MRIHLNCRNFKSRNYDSSVSSGHVKNPGWVDLKEMAPANVKEAISEGADICPSLGCKY